MTKEDFRKDTDEITKRLDVIIYLLLEQKRQNGVSQRQLIKELTKMGLKDFEIARILGSTKGYVAKEKSLIKKSK